MKSGNLESRPEIFLAMGFNVNTSLGFVQLLASYHNQFSHGKTPPPLLDPHRQFGVELGSYLPWSDSICARGRTIDPLTLRVMVVTATPITGSLQSRANLVLTSPGKRLYIYTIGSK